MKLTQVFIIVMVLFALLLPASDAAPGRIPVKAIKGAGRAIGKGFRAFNAANTAHDIAGFFKPKHKKKH